MSSINLAGPQAATVALQLVVFSLGEEEYALPITDVQEIIRYTEPRAVASESPWIRGVISLRGKIVPVCDLATRLGLPVDGERANIVIVETASGTAGVIVDEVAGGPDRRRVEPRAAAVRGRRRRRGDRQGRRPARRAAQPERHPRRGRAGRGRVTNGRPPRVVVADDSSFMRRLPRGRARRRRLRRRRHGRERRRGARALQRRAAGRALARPRDAGHERARRAAAPARDGVHDPRRRRVGVLAGVRRARRRRPRRGRVRPRREARAGRAHRLLPARAAREGRARRPLRRTAPRTRGRRRRERACGAPAPAGAAPS